MALSWTLGSHTDWPARRCLSWCVSRVVGPTAEARLTGVATRLALLFDGGALLDARWPRAAAAS